MGVRECKGSVFVVTTATIPDLRASDRGLSYYLRPGSRPQDRVSFSATPKLSLRPYRERSAGRRKPAAPVQCDARDPRPGPRPPDSTTDPAGTRTRRPSGSDPGRPPSD